MKSRTHFLVLIGLITLVFGIARFTFLRRNQEPVQIYSATVSRDCAPWDGSAFIVKIPLNNRSTIDVSIWQTPAILYSTRFSFPDDTMQIGKAILTHATSQPEILTVEVWFEGVSEEKPVEGRFRLTSENGVEVAGRFVAAWEHQIVLCG